MRIVKKIIYNLKEYSLKTIRLIFNYINGGENCIVCGNITYLYPVCKKCISKYFFIDKEMFKNRCEICGRELISTFRFCTQCKENHLFQNTNKVIPLFSYRLWNKELLFLWKINGERNLSFFFASIVNKALNILNYKIIVPVPPRKGKIRKNGWDQIDELCKILSEKYGYIVLKLLKRISTEEQKKLKREDRIDTIKNAYIFEDINIIKKELKKNNGILPKSVCLIDDVCTTGSTVECCSKILKSQGIKEVNVITLFIVD